MINKINSSPSFTSKVIVPYAPGKNGLIGGSGRSFDDNMATALYEHFLPQIKELENNGDDNSVYLYGFSSSVSNPCGYQPASTFCLEMSVVERKNGLVYLMSKTESSGPRLKIEKIDLTKMYSSIKTKLKEYEKEEFGYSEKKFRMYNPFMDYYV